MPRVLASIGLVRWRLALVVVLASAGCSGPLSPESGPVPTDLGAVMVTVTDRSAAAVRNTYVQVHDIPNAVGTFFRVGQWTDATGVTTITAIPAGRHRVEVTPPDGFTILPADSLQSVDVVKGVSVRVSFVLTKL